LQHFRNPAAPKDPPLGDFRQWPDSSFSSTLFPANSQPEQVAEGGFDFGYLGGADFAHAA